MRDFTIRTGALSAMAAALLLAAPAAPLQARQSPQSRPRQGDEQRADDVYQLGTELVILDVSVVDRGNRPVFDISKDRFQVLEDGAPQQIEFFTREQAPVSMALAIDTSGSMRTKLESVTQAVTNLVRTNQPQDETAVIEFKDTRGHRLTARELCGTQPPRTGDQHEALAVRAYEDRLQNAVTADARRQLVEAGLRERPPRIGRRFVDHVRCQLSELTHSDTSSEMAPGPLGRRRRARDEPLAQWDGWTWVGPSGVGLGGRSRADAGSARLQTTASAPWRGDGWRCGRERTVRPARACAD